MEKYIPILIYWLLVSSCLAFGQNATILDGSARSVALSDAMGAITSWSSNNPASWSQLSDYTAAVSAGRLFGMNELSPASAALMIPTQFGTVGVLGRSYGFDAYRQTQVAAGWARGFSFGSQRSIHVGARLQYTHLRQGADYGSAGTAGLSVGVLTPVLHTFNIGAYVTNLNQPSIHGHNLPREIGIAWSYSIASNARLLGELHKDVRHPISVRTGLEWMPVEPLALRIGTATAPYRFSGGAGFRLGWLQADIGGVFHEVLGLSPIASIQMAW